MATFPQYNSSRNITAKQSQPLRNEASKPFENQQQIVGAMSEMAQKWSDANDVMQYTEAKSMYEVGSADILARASADPDFKNSGKYYKELEDLKSNSTKGISNAVARDKFSMEADYGNQISAIKIDTNFKNKQLKYSQFTLGQSVESLYQRRISASNANEAQKIDFEIKELLALNVGTGVISEEEADTMIKETKKNAAEFDAVANPDLFLARGKDFYGIPDDDYTKAKETATNSKERNKKELEKLEAENQTQIEADLLMGLADKKVDKLSVPDITSKMMTGEISKEFGNAYIRVLTSPKHIDPKGKSGRKVEKSGFTKYAKEIFKTGTEEDQKKAIIRMLDGAADGELDDEQLAVLLKAANDKDKKGKIAGIIDAIGNLGKSRVDFSGERMTYDFIKNIVAGKDPEEAQKEAVDKEQIRVNPNRTTYTLGETYSLPAGMLTVVGYDDAGNPKFKKAK